MVAFDHLDLKARQKRSGSDACAHGSTADNADLSERTGRYAFGARRFANGALGKEDIAQSCGLRRAFEAHEALALKLQGVCSAMIKGITHGGGGLMRRVLTTRFCGELGDGRVPCSALDLWRSAGEQRRWQGLCRGVLRQRDGSIEQFALGDGVKESKLMGLARADRFTRDREARGLNGVDQSRQTHSAACARDEAEVDFGQADLRGWGPDTVRAGERQLKSATKGGAMNGSDPRAGCGLDCIEKVGQHWLKEGFVKLANIRPCNKSASRTGEHNGGRFALFCCDERVHQTLAYRLGRGVHRWVVDGEHGDIAVHCGGDNRHMSAPLGPFRAKVSRSAPKVNRAVGYLS